MLKNAPPPAAGAGQPPQQTPHNLILEDRSRMTVTGVLRMLRCDEFGAAMETGRGTLAVGGQGLSVQKLSLESGEVCLEGRIDSVAYTENRVSSGGFWHRLVHG